VQELLGDNEDIKILRGKESAHLIPQFLMLSYLGRLRLRESQENNRAFSIPSASSVNAHLRKLSGVGMVGLPNFALDDKFNSKSPFVAEGTAVGHVAGKAKPTTKLLVMARRGTFLPYRDGLKEQFARLDAGVDSMVRGYLRALIRWADDWPELAQAANEEAKAESSNLTSDQDTVRGLPKAVAKWMSRVRFPDYAVGDVTSIIDSSGQESSTPAKEVAAGIARVLVESVSLAVAQRHFDPTLSVLTAYNSIRPQQSKALAQHLIVAAQDLQEIDQELSMYYRLVAEEITPGMRPDPAALRAMHERIGVFAQYLDTVLNLTKQGGEAE
jgi:hypothetical protein